MTLKCLQSIWTGKYLSELYVVFYCRVCSPTKVAHSDNAGQQLQIPENFSKNETVRLPF